MRYAIVFLFAVFFVVLQPFPGWTAMDIPYLSPGDQPYEPLPPEEGSGEIYDPPPVAFDAPPDVVVVPSGSTYVYMIPDTPGFYFYGGYWYRYHRGYWFRSSAYNGRWRYIESSRVPRYILDVPPEYVYHIPRGYHRVRYNDLHRNWRAWDNRHHWNRYDWFKHELRDDIRRERYDRIRGDRDRDRGRDHGRDRGRDHDRDRDRDKQGGHRDGGRGDTVGRDKQGGRNKSGGTHGGDSNQIMNPIGVTQGGHRDGGKGSGRGDTVGRDKQGGKNKSGVTQGGGTQGGDGNKIMNPIGVTQGGQRGGQTGGQTSGRSNPGSTQGGGTKGGDSNKIMNPIGVTQGGKAGGSKSDSSRGKEKDDGNREGHRGGR
ncbi:MAG: hypothetical protein C0402_02625 [Thermodesulfovibrio sp.]|nr:hypothetical protein [Thermodesulfovibrio sp.]